MVDLSAYLKGKCEASCVPALKRSLFVPRSNRSKMTRKPNSLWIGIWAAAALLAATFVRADDANQAKARSLVDAAIQLTDSNQALKMLWQATEIDPTFNESYVYLGLYYNSREDFPKVVEVYQKLVKYQPGEVSAYLNIGEAYMSFNPPRFDQAEIYYRKGYELDPKSSFAALRLGQTLAHTGDRAGAIRYLKQASADSAANPTIADEANKALREMAAF
jgi:tetratricopeptide (TPR) repeat protein